MSRKHLASHHAPGTGKTAASSRMCLNYLLNNERESEKQTPATTSTTGTPKSVICQSIGDGQNYRNTGNTHRHTDNSTGGRLGSVEGLGNSPEIIGGSSSKEKKFVCEQCGTGFGMKSNLKRHIMTVHEDRRGYQCVTCGAAFGLKQNLATHIRVKHEKRRPFQCDVCGVSFGYKQVLQNHRRNIHGIDQ